MIVSISLHFDPFLFFEWFSWQITGGNSHKGH